MSIIDQPTAEFDDNGRPVALMTRDRQSEGRLELLNNDQVEQVRVTMPRPMSASGRLTGTGVAQAIATGFPADLVFGKANSASYVAFMKHAGCWLRNTDTLSTIAARTDAVSLAKDGFSVGTDAVVNAAGVTVDWFAWGDNGSDSVRSYSWHGNATAGRVIEGTKGLDIAAAIIKRDDAQDAVLVMGSESWLTDGTAGTYAAINADGTLTLNAAANVNPWVGVSGEACNALVILNKPENIVVREYLGTGADRRIPLPWEPGALLIWPLAVTSGKVQIWTAGMPANTSATSNGAVHQTGRITGVDASGFSIGTNVAVNQNGVRYAVIAFRNMGAGHVRRAPAFITRRQKAVQLATGYIDCSTSDTLAVNGAHSIEFWGSYTPIDETPFAGGATVNDEVGKQHPLIWRSLGADGGSATISQSWGLGLYAPMNQGVAGWRGCSILTPSTRFFNLVQNSGGNLDYNPFNTGYVIDGGRLAHIVVATDGLGAWWAAVDGVPIKERKRNVSQVGPMTPNAAWPLAGARTVIGARQRAGGAPEFAHSLAFRRARLYGRGVSFAEMRALYLHATRGGADPAADFVEEWDANNAAGATLLATRYSANNGAIVNGAVI